MTGARLNEYVRDYLGEEFTAKDFRTWGGTLTAAIAFAERGPVEGAAEQRRAVAAVMRRVGQELGNTPAVARSSYVGPAVVDQRAEVVLELDVAPGAADLLLSGEPAPHQGDPVVGPALDVTAVGGGDLQQLHDHGQRQRVGEAGDEIDLPVGGESVDETFGQGPDPGLEPGHPPGSEGGGDHPPERAVIGRVEAHDRAELVEVVARVVLRELAHPLHDGAVGEHGLDAEHEVTRHSVEEDAVAAGSRR